MIQIKPNVFYDDEKNLYYKEFKKDKWYTVKGLKFRLGICRTYARNVEYMTHKLNDLGLHTPEIVEVDDYFFTCTEVEGEGLNHYRKKHGAKAFREELLYIFITITRAGFIHVDPHTQNFLCDGKKIIIIDIDSIFDLADVPFKFLPRQKHLYKLWRRIGYDDDFLIQVAKNWPRRTVLQKSMDIAYSVRTCFLANIGRGNKEEQKFLKFITPHFPS